MVVLTLVWQIRVRYILRDGSEWSLGYLTVESPPPEAGAVARCGQANDTLVIIAAFSLFLFVGVLASGVLS